MDQRKQAILKARALQLSRIEQLPTAFKGTSIEVVEFKIASETYALETSYIREVYPIKEYTPLPCVPAFVLGLINVRRKVLSLIDLGDFFELPKAEEIVGKKAIILGEDGMEFGILADGAIQVSSILLTDIQPPLPTLTAMRGEFLKGITHDGRAILDARKLFDSKKLIVDEAP